MYASQQVERLEQTPVRTVTLPACFFHSIDSSRVVLSRPPREQHRAEKKLMFIDSGVSRRTYQGH